MTYYCRADYNNYRSMQVPGVTPSTTTLRNYLLIRRAFRTESMAALKSITGQGIEGHSRISVTFLKLKEFTSLSNKPREQAMYLQIYARYGCCCTVEQEEHS